jgi:hypothetical protein
MDHPHFGQPWDFFADVIGGFLSLMGGVVVFVFTHWWLFLIGFVLWGLIAWIYNAWREAAECATAARREPRPTVRVTTDTKPAINKLSEYASFTDAVARLQADNTRTTVEKLGELGRQYSGHIERLRSAGVLTEEVEEGFQSFAEFSASAISGQCVSFNRGLSNNEEKPRDE